MVPVRELWMGVICMRCVCEGCMRGHEDGCEEGYEWGYEGVCG